jgi:hypothetical protein
MTGSNPHPGETTWEHILHEIRAHDGGLIEALETFGRETTETLHRLAERIEARHTLADARHAVEAHLDVLDSRLAAMAARLDEHAAALEARG